MTEKERAPFFDMFNQDKNRYADEMRQFDEQGFFINQQGVNSRTLTFEKATLQDHVIQPKK